MKLVIAIALVSAAAAVPLYKQGLLVTTSEEDALFEKFKMEHGKAYYDDHDESFRKNIFLNNLRKIRQHNAEAETGAHTHTLAMNQFGDLSFEEFHQQYTGFKGLRHRHMRSKNTEDLSHVAVADSIDWVAKGAVTDVKNQGSCGSCWSFSTTGSVEGAWYIAKNSLVSLSEQQLMDCSKSEGNDSCEGGLMDYAFEYLISSKGSCTEDSYPYKAKDENSCTRCTAVATISDYKDVAESESALEAAVSQQPVSIAIEADQESFQFYSSGVLTKACGTKLDHGVLAVGFGELDGTKYWKVKNSWGATWGMEGYILLERGNTQSGGQCGILMSASYPVV